MAEEMTDEYIPDDFDESSSYVEILAIIKKSPKIGSECPAAYTSTPPKETGEESSLKCMLLRDEQQFEKCETCELLKKVVEKSM